MYKDNVRRKYRFFGVLVILIVLVFLLLINKLSFFDKKENTGYFLEPELTQSNIHVKYLELKKTSHKDIEGELLGIEYKLGFLSEKSVTDQNDEKLGIELILPKKHFELLGVSSAGTSYSFKVEDKANKLYSTTYINASATIREEELNTLFESHSGFKLKIYSNNKEIQSIIIPEEYVNNFIEK